MLISQITKRPAKHAGQKFKALVAALQELRAERPVAVLLEPAVWQVRPDEEQSCPRRCLRTGAKLCCVRA